MSDNTTTQTAIPALEPVQVTLELPGQLYKEYSVLVGAGLFMSVEEALRQAVLTSWRFDRGIHHSIRVDLGPDDKTTDQADPEPAPSAEA